MVNKTAGLKFAVKALPKLEAERCDVWYLCKWISKLKVASAAMKRAYNNGGYRFLFIT
jgi:hypothetical protein